MPTINEYSNQPGKYVACLILIINLIPMSSLLKAIAEMPCNHWLVLLYSKSEISYHNLHCHLNIFWFAVASECRSTETIYHWIKEQVDIIWKETVTYQFVFVVCFNCMTQFGPLMAIQICLCNMRHSFGLKWAFPDRILQLEIHLNVIRNQKSFRIWRKLSNNSKL